MEFLIAILAVAVVLGILYGTWYVYDAEEEYRAALEEVARANAELEQVRKEAIDNLLLLKSLRAERGRLRKEMEEVNEELHRL